MEELTMRQICHNELHGGCIQIGTPFISITLDVLGYDDNVKRVLFGSLKNNHPKHD